ncbi:MAG: autotransporter outer membrane beta-barrel domain-containing protein [Alphaproteobacteria bacterium]|nr:autotransporter outer membrane beta-barrel domain-containing protein [Alphaproteobacteria bacterium]
MIRFRHPYALVLSCLLITTPSFVNAQAIADYTTTSDQTTVGTVFDSKGATAASGSTLETDYNQILSGTSAQISESAQSMLPTTAYGMTGAANALASTEERNIMGRLRTLRNRSVLRPSKVVAARRAPVIYPLQKTDDTLLDLRNAKKTPTLSSRHGTTNNYRSYSPALYKDAPTEPTHPYAIERAYDATMGLITTGAGAPNENHRDLDEPRVRLVPNMADRAAAKALNIAGDLGGQGQVWATATNGMPRRVAVTLSESNRDAAAHYRGQPLSNLTTNDQIVILPVTTRAQPIYASHEPIPLIIEPPRTVGSPMGESLNGPPLGESLNNVPPPVIYGPDDVVPTQEAVPQAPARPAPFVYRKLDQSKSLTTPQLGTPTKDRTTLTIQQNNAYALASSQNTNFLAHVPPRKTTETGTLLWVDPTNQQEKQTQPQPNLSAMTKASSNEPAPAEEIAYGTQAVPLYETGAINPDRRWGFFITGTTGFGSDELQKTSDKTKTVTAGFTTGADYRINDQSYLGLALTYVHSSLSTGNFGDLQSNSTALSLYGTTEYATNAYVDGYISMGYLNMDSERTLFAAGSTTGKAKTTPDGYQFAGKVETGYDYKQAAWSYGPFAGFRLAYAHFGDFTEEDAGNFNLKVRGLDNLSAIANFGINGSHRYVMSNGGVLMPSLRIGYNHEFGDDRSNIKAEFVNLANSSFTTKSDKKSRDWINLSPSISASLPNDWTLVAQYEHDFFRDDVNENIFNLAAHYKW